MLLLQGKSFNDERVGNDVLDENMRKDLDRAELEQDESVSLGEIESPSAQPVMILPIRW